MNNILKKVLSIILVFFVSAGCFAFAGCDDYEDPALKWNPKIPQVTVGMTLQTALKDVTVYFAEDGKTDSASGYDELIEKSASVSWDGSSETVQKREEAGKKPTIRISWKGYVLYIEYSFKQETVSPYYGGQSNQHFFMDKDADGKCDTCESTDKNDGQHYASYG